MDRIRAHLTYSNVMATLAVFLVLGGGAYAAFHLPKNSVRSFNIVNGQVKGVDVKESSLGRVPSAISANPIAFARVSKAGDVIEAQSNRVGDGNVAFHGNAGDGTYCFSGLGFTPKGGQVTVDFRDSAFEQPQLGVGTAGGCPPGSQAVVVTYNGNLTSDAGFFIAFYR
jgi:hypothetical protein